MAASLGMNRVGLTDAPVELTRQTWRSGGGHGTEAPDSTTEDVVRMTRGEGAGSTHRHREADEDFSVLGGTAASSWGSRPPACLPRCAYQDEDLLALAVTSRILTTEADGPDPSGWGQKLDSSCRGPRRRGRCAGPQTASTFAGTGTS